MKGKNPFAVDTSYFTLRAYRLSNDLYKVQVSSTDSLHSLTSILPRLREAVELRERRKSTLILLFPYSKAT